MIIKELQIKDKYELNSKVVIIKNKHFYKKKFNLQNKNKNN